MTTGMTPPPISAKSDAWLKLKVWLKKRITELHEELETDGVDPQLARGRIAEIRNIIKTVEPDLPVEGTSSLY